MAKRFIKVKFFYGKNTESTCIVLKTKKVPMYKETFDVVFKRVFDFAHKKLETGKIYIFVLTPKKDTGNWEFDISKLYEKRQIV